MDDTKKNGVMNPGTETEEEERWSLGKYGMKRDRYLSEQYPRLRERMIADGTLTDYLYQLDEQATERVERMVEHMAAQADLPDRKTQPYQWAQHMTMLKAQAEEVVYREMIYTEEDEPD